MGKQFLITSSSSITGNKFAVRKIMYDNAIESVQL